MLADGIAVLFGFKDWRDNFNDTYQLTVSDTTATLTQLTLTNAGDSPCARHAHAMTVFAAGTAVLFGGIVPLSELAGFEANDADQVTVSATTAHGHLWQVKTAGMPMQRLCFLMALLWFSAVTAALS